MACDETTAQRIRKMLDGEPGIGEKAMFGGLAFTLRLPPKQVCLNRRPLYFQQARFAPQAAAVAG